MRTVFTLQGGALSFLLCIGLSPNHAIAQSCAKGSITGPGINQLQLCSGGTDPHETVSWVKAYNVYTRTECNRAGWQSTNQDDGSVYGEPTGECGYTGANTPPVCSPAFDPPVDMGFDGTDHRFRLTNYTNVYGGSGCTLSGPNNYVEPLTNQGCTGDFCCGLQNQCEQIGTWDVNCECTPNSPIIVDVESDGYDLTGLARGVLFDVQGNGRPVRLGWTQARDDDAFLVLDRNGNGRIDDGTELFGNAAAQPSPPPGISRNGFNALAVFDSNSDRVINSSDPVYNSLRLWRDVNHNGISEARELRLLHEEGVKSIGLEYRESRRKDRHGNLFRYRAQLGYMNGRSGWVYDVYLVSESDDDEF